MSDLTTAITYEEVLKDAEDIKACAKKMEEIFDDFSSTMRQIAADDVFAGTASETLEQKFGVLKTKLSSYTRTVENFSAVISNASDATQRTEQSLAAAAEEMPS